jgi:ferric-dicitrate binding protein FerR (iron transport regulator)
LTVVSPSGVRLDDGLLTGSVQPGGRHGFTVWTAAARIDDIGTRFGVAAIRSGDSVVHVFDGLVQVDPAGDDETTTHLVEAGQSLRVRYSGGSVVGALEDRPKSGRSRQRPIRRRSRSISPQHPTMPIRGAALEGG